MSETVVRFGLVGYGFGGRYFHAPLIAGAAGAALAGVVTRSPERRAEVARDHPGVAVHDTVDDLLAAGVDAVTVCTPAATHTAVTDDLLRRGVPVVCDKPFAWDAQAARSTVELAEREGVLLSPYQNRRWDSDLLTVRRLLDAGALGEVRRLESAFERFAPDPEPPAAGGGLLRDFGSHLVDQALHLFGPAHRVYAETHEVAPGSEDDFLLLLQHAGGVLSQLSGAWRQGAPRPRFRVSGSEATFVVTAPMDGQEDALVVGRRRARGTTGVVSRRLPGGRCTAGPSGRSCPASAAAGTSSTSCSLPRCGERAPSRSTRGTPWPPRPCSTPPAPAPRAASRSRCRRSCADARTPRRNGRPRNDIDRRSRGNNQRTCADTRTLDVDQRTLETMSSAALPADSEPAEHDERRARDRVTAGFLTAVAQEVGDQSLTPVALARAVVRVLPVDGASLSTMVSVLRLPLGASDESSRQAEELQSTLGEGPCLDAAESQTTVVADDGGLQRRWPRYAAELVRRTPFRAVAAVPLQAVGHGVFAALDLYSTGLRIGDRLDRREVDGVVTAVAALLSVCVAQIQDIDVPEAGPDWYRAAAGRRHDVWMAIGMVMATRAIRTSGALALLRAHASVTGCTLDDVATKMIQGRLQVADLAGPPSVAGR